MPDGEIVSARGAWPTPVGWRWMRRSRAAAVVAVASAALLVVSGLVAADGYAEAHGHALDPTDPVNYDVFVLRNDSRARLYVRRCDDGSCVRLDEHDDWVPVEPGSAVTDQVWWGADTPILYAVSDVSAVHAARRCVRLDASTKTASATTVWLSVTVGCGG